MAELMLVNPRRRRKSKASAPKRRRRHSLASRAKSTAVSTFRSLRRRYRRNPLPKSSDIVNDFKNGAIGAAGALLVDVAMQKLPIPANLKTGQMAPIVKGLVGIGVGIAVAKFGKNRVLGKQLANGAVTVALYNQGKQMIGPALGLNGWEDGPLMGWDEGTLLSGGDFGAYASNRNQFEVGGYVTGAPIVN